MVNQSTSHRQRGAQSGAVYDNDVEQSSRKTVEELQPERRNRIQLEIQLDWSTAELRSLKDKQNYCCDSYCIVMPGGPTHHWDRCNMHKEWTAVHWVIF